MPFGEMTITLDDVGTLLGIPVTAIPVHASTSMGFTEQVDLLDRGLGVDRASASAELRVARGGVVRMGWIYRVCGDVTPRSSVEQVECAARGYLLYLLGCTLFADKSSTRVPVYYLSLLMDLGRVCHYALGGWHICIPSWGLPRGQMCTLYAYLYPQLGTATRSLCMGGCRNGYLTLLMVNVYTLYIHTHVPS